MGFCSSLRLVASSQLCCMKPTEVAVSPEGLDPHLQPPSFHSALHYPSRSHRLLLPVLCTALIVLTLNLNHCRFLLFLPFPSLLLNCLFYSPFSLCIPRHMDMLNIIFFLLSHLLQSVLVSLHSFSFMSQLSFSNFFPCPWVMSALDHNGSVSLRSMTAEDISFEVPD